MKTSIPHYIHVFPKTKEKPSKKCRVNSKGNDISILGHSSPKSVSL